MSHPLPHPLPSVGDTATHITPDGSAWVRTVTNVTSYGSVHYTLTSPDGVQFEMSQAVKEWTAAVAGPSPTHVVGGTRRAPDPADPPQTWDALVSLLLSVPPVEWDIDRTSSTPLATLGAGYSSNSMLIQISIRDDTVLWMQVGNGNRGFRLHPPNTNRRQREQMEALADHVFQRGADLESKLAYIFGGDFPTGATF